jgi:hypothetical protein
MITTLSCPEDRKNEESEAHVTGIENIRVTFDEVFQGQALYSGKTLNKYSNDQRIWENSLRSHSSVN